MSATNVNGYVARTTAGDIDVSKLGVTDYHEHVFQISPLLPGEDLDDPELSTREVVSLATSGIQTMIDATPIGLGRRPMALNQIARKAGLHIVATTGCHREAHYNTNHPILQKSVESLAEIFYAELIQGMGSCALNICEERTDIPAGVLKVGLGYWSITRFEQRVIEAVTVAHERTGAPLMIHLEFGSVAHEILDRLAEYGVALDRVALAHMDRNPDPGLHAELAQRGAYLGYDGMARHRSWPDSTLIECFVRTTSQSGAHRILLGGDVARQSRYRAYGGLPGLDYVTRRFIPRLKEAAGAENVQTALLTNPSRWLGWRTEGKLLRWYA